MSRAIVIGGSIAGMCTARVLCDFFDEVLLLDRDHYPEVAQARVGVPQARHVHALLARGQRELELLFPGFAVAMLAAGALQVDPGADFATRRKPGWQAVGGSGIEMFSVSRDLLEFAVRSLLRRQTKVVLREGAQVSGLLGDPSGAARVHGVRVRVEGQGEQDLAADLVVDASGRQSHVDDWMRALGAEPAEKQVVDAHVGYASRFYKAPAGVQRPASWWWKGLWIEPEPPNLPRGGVVFPIEGDRWIVTAVGIAPHYPATDEQGFVDFFETLSSRAIARALPHAEPISAVFGNRSMANVFRRYERQREPLPGFVALGDSVCAFNPIYGQGMSTASACASILRDVLRERGRTGFERVFWMRQAAFLSEVWNLATAADFNWPTTEGARPKTPKPIAKYIALALRCAHEDAALRRHLMPIFHLVAPVRVFFDPRFIAKVLLHAGRTQLATRVFGAQPIPDAPPG